VPGGTSNACNITRIAGGTNQFSDLKTAFPSLSDQILARRLSDLVSEALIDKTIVKEKPPKRIVYTITEKGPELLRVIDDLHDRGLKWR